MTVSYPVWGCVTRLSQQSLWIPEITSLQESERQRAWQNGEYGPNQVTPGSLIPITRGSGQVHVTPGPQVCICEIIYLLWTREEPSVWPYLV